MLLTNKLLVVMQRNGFFGVCMLYHVSKRSSVFYGTLRIYVARVSKDGKLMNSRPCNDCIIKMKRAGIKEVIYSTGTQEIYRVEKINDMELLHISSGYRHIKNN